MTPPLSYGKKKISWYKELYKLFYKSYGNKLSLQSLKSSDDRKENLDDKKYIDSLGGAFVPMPHCPHLPIYGVIYTSRYCIFGHDLYLYLGIFGY